MQHAFTGAEAARLRELLEIEAVRQMRLDYSLLMDQRDIPALMALFTDDALCEYGPYGTWRGRQVIENSYNAVFTGDLQAPFTSLHLNTNHRVQILSATRATGQCYLTDIATHVAADANPILWFAIYDEEYRKQGEQWKFARTSLQFLWPERHLSATYARGRTGA